MTRIWKKIPRVTHLCACGCGSMVTGTKSRMYAKPYCKFKAYLNRKAQPGWQPNSKFDNTQPKSNPLEGIFFDKDMSSPI